MKKSLFVVLLFALSCEESYTPPMNRAPVYAATSAYAYDVTNPQVIVYMTNNGTEPISFDRWDGTIFYYRDRLTDSGWVEWTQIGIYSGSVQERYTLDLDHVYADTILVRKPGTYRFRFPILPNNDLARSSTVISNTFVIE